MLIFATILSANITNFAIILYGQLEDENIHAFLKFNDIPGLHPITGLGP